MEFQENKAEKEIKQPVCDGISEEAYFQELADTHRRARGREEYWHQRQLWGTGEDRLSPEMREQRRSVAAQDDDAYIQQLQDYYRVLAFEHASDTDADFSRDEVERSAAEWAKAHLIHDRMLLLDQDPTPDQLYFLYFDFRRSVQSGPLAAISGDIDTLRCSMLVDERRQDVVRMADSYGASVIARKLLADWRSQAYQTGRPGYEFVSPECAYSALANADKLPLNKDDYIVALEALKVHGEWDPTLQIKAVQVLKGITYRSKKVSDIVRSIKSDEERDRAGIKVHDEGPSTARGYIRYSQDAALRFVEASMQSSIPSGGGHSAYIRYLTRKDYSG